MYPGIIDFEFYPGINRRMSNVPVSSHPPETPCAAFLGTSRIASGPLIEVAAEAKAVLSKNRTASILIFDDASGGLVEVDFRGTKRDLVRRLRELASPEPDPEPKAPRGPGRPKLGVVSREVTLLPRQWDWLSDQPGGASVTLRRLVEGARRANAAVDRQRAARNAAYKFMVAMAGDEPGFEDASRALFAGDCQAFETAVGDWPRDVRDHVKKLAATGLAA